MAEKQKKVVESTEKGIFINFSEYIETSSILEDFTTLMELPGLSKDQKKALISIKKYWVERIKNSENWNKSRHWGYQKETLSARIDDDLYEQLFSARENINDYIKNFVRAFLRDPELRIEFNEKKQQQLSKDLDSIQNFMVGQARDIDHTEFNKQLNEIYPRTVSGEVRNIEKELFVYYCYFHTSTSISYNLRIGLIHFSDLAKEAPIEKHEVKEILSSFINEKNQPT